MAEVEVEALTILVSEEALISLSIETSVLEKIVQEVFSMVSAN